MICEEGEKKASSANGRRETEKSEREMAERKVGEIQSVTGFKVLILAGRWMGPCGRCEKETNSANNQ